MDRAGKTAKSFTDLFLLHPAGKISGIHVIDSRSKDHIHILAFAKSFIPFEVPGIAVIILVGTELGGVDKDRNRDGIRTVFACGINEGKMPFMKKAHGGDQAHSLALFFCVHAPFLEFGNGMNDLCHNISCLSPKLT